MKLNKIITLKNLIYAFKYLFEYMDNCPRRKFGSKLGLGFGLGLILGLGGNFLQGKNPLDLEPFLFRFFEFFDG